MVHFCPVIIRHGQSLTVTILMSWKTVTTYAKLLFLLGNYDLHVKGGEEQGEKTKPLHSISPQHPPAVPK